MDALKLIKELADYAGISEKTAKESLDFLRSKKYLSVSKPYEEQEISEKNKVNEAAAALLPNIDNLTDAYYYVKDNVQDNILFEQFDKTIKLGDETVAKWLSITSKTLENYRKRKRLRLKTALKEHMVLLLSLYEHGREVFGSIQEFETWLSHKNILLDDTEPSEFLDTITGVSFIDNRLTAIEFGENV